MLYPPTNSPILIFSTFDTPSCGNLPLRGVLLRHLTQMSSYNLRFYPNRKALKIALFSNQDFLVFQKGLLLHSERTPFTLQKDSF